MLEVRSTKSLKRHYIGMMSPDLIGSNAREDQLAGHHRRNSLQTANQSNARPRRGEVWRLAQWAGEVESRFPRFHARFRLKHHMTNVLCEGRLTDVMRAAATQSQVRLRASHARECRCVCWVRTRRLEENRDCCAKAENQRTCAIACARRRKSVLM
jgi:hypothetical protein